MTVIHANLILATENVFLIFKFGNFSIKVVALCLIYSQNTEVLEAQPPAITDYCSLKYYHTPTMWRRKALLKKIFVVFFLKERSDPKLKLVFSSLSAPKCNWHQSLMKTCLRTLDPIQGTPLAYSRPLGT